MAPIYIIVSTPLVSPSTLATLVFQYCVSSVGNPGYIEAGDIVFLSNTQDWIPLLGAGGSGPTPGVSPTGLYGVACNSGYRSQPLTVCIADQNFTFGLTAPTMSTGYAYASYDVGHMIRSDSLVPTDYRFCVGIAQAYNKMSLNLSATGQTA